MRIFLLTVLFFLIHRGDLLAQYEFYSAKDISDLGQETFNDIIDFKIIDNSIFITDFKGPKIYKFSLNGELINSTGRSGRGPGEFEFGPRHITSQGEFVYVTSMSPLVKIYDLDLNFIEHKRFIDFASNIYGVHSANSDILVIVPTQFYEESIFIYNVESEEREGVFLDFEIAPGLLSKYDIYSFGEKWLFVWEFQNRFELYDSNFSKISSFKLPNIPDKADGKYSDSPFIPKEANSYRAKVYQQGAFFPYGYFFTSIIKLDEESLLVQFGIQTGGDEKAVITDLEGNIKQEVELPQKGSVVLKYHNNILYMKERESLSVFAYEFKEN